MRAERMLWRIAVACAALLLLAPVAPRTSWTALPQSEVRAQGGGMTHSAGWDWLAPLMGILAIAGLIAGRWQRPRVAGAAFGAALASISLAAAVAATLGHWLDLRSGSLDLAGWVISPAPAVVYFALIAAVGVVVALLLLGRWLRRDDELQPH